MHTRRKERVLFLFLLILSMDFKKEVSPSCALGEQLARFPFSSVLSPPLERGGYPCKNSADVEMVADSSFFFFFLLLLLSS